MKIDKVLNKKNKENLLLSSFLTIGSAGLALGVNSNLSILFFFAIPTLMIEGLNYIKLKKNKPASIIEGFIHNQYMKSFDNWFYNYVEKSSSNIEKKYKTIYTSMWLSTHNIDVFDLININTTHYKTISDELQKSNATKYTLTDLFKTFNKEQLVDYDFFLKEDINDENKLNIAREVYKDFNHLGLLGENIENWNLGTFRTLLHIQDYRFSPEDIKVIKLYTKKIKESNVTFNNYDLIHKLFIEDKFTMQSIEKILKNENNLDNIKVLIEYFTSLQTVSEKAYDKHIEILSKHCEKLTLEKELPQRPHHSINKVKRKI